MGTCELCGNVVDSTLTVRVAGSNMQSCNNCKHLGTLVNSFDIKEKTHSFKKSKKNEDVELEVISNYSPIINSALAKKGLNVQQLARMLNIKESTLNKYFSGKIRPDVVTARKLENFFEIKLLIEKESIDISEMLIDENKEDEPLSLGDMIKKQMEQSKQK